MAVGAHGNSRNCHLCGKTVAVTIAGKYRKHNDPKTKDECDASGTFVPGKKVEETEEPMSADPGDILTTAADLDEAAEEPPPLPGADAYTEELGALAAQQLDRYRETAAETVVAEPLTPFAQPAPVPLDVLLDVPVPAGTELVYDTRPIPFLKEQPAFAQPAQPSRSPAVAPESMTVLGERIAAQMKEMFFHYSNRKTEDNRSAQTTLGPSEIGTPCDRRLAMSLLRMPAVNPGGDGWAAFVGTCIHEGLAKMFEWADGGSGRYAVEIPLSLPNEHVPYGTGDLLDRVLCVFDDHKGMGRWSRNKLRAQGPSDTYRVQVHTYGLGARLRGEKVEHVAIIAWPRDESSLDDLYVWTEPYDPAIARKGLERVDAIAATVDTLSQDMEPHQVAAGFSIADDCRFCPFYLPGAADLSKGGCNGRV